MDLCIRMLRAYFTQNYSDFMHKPSFEKISLSNAIKGIERVNPELAKIIKDLSPSDDHTLYVLNSPYGCLHTRNGKLYLPNAQGLMLPLNDYKGLREDLSYNRGSNPVSLVLKNSFEVFINYEQRTITSGLMVEKGSLFGTWIVLNKQFAHHPTFIWNISAGARSIFMLPKIFDSLGYARLSDKFNVDVDVPKDLMGHYNVFKALANSPLFNDKWSASLLMFGKKWFEHFDDRAWIDFNYYLYRTSWKGSEYFRNKPILNLIYSIVKDKKNLKPNPYLADTVENLLAVSMGGAIGFSPAMNELFAPIKRLQEIFVDIYQLRDYAPIIMQPRLFSLHDNNNPIYYSLLFPTTMEFAPKSKNFSSHIGDLKDVKYLLLKYLDVIANNELNLAPTPIYELVNKVKFDFFHHQSANDKEGMLRNVTKIFEEDPAFAEAAKVTKNKGLPENSKFLKACIRISKTTESNANSDNNSKNSDE